MSAFAIKMDLPAALAGVDGLVEDMQAAARPAAQAGAQVLYEQVVKNVAALGKKTGNLRSSIYQAYSKDRSSAGDAVYHIAWNQKKAPHGHLVEFGHLQRYEVSNDPTTGRFITHKDRPITPKLIAAKPFLRNAYASHSAIALVAMENRYYEELQKRGVTK